MHTSTFWSIASLSAAILLTSLPATAQQPPAPSDAPPKLEKLEESEPPSIKIGTPEDKHKITEIRDDSGIKEIKVESGKSTYYLKPNHQVGNALPGDAQSTTNRGAEWKILQFGGSADKLPSSGDAVSTPKN